MTEVHLVCDPCWHQPRQILGETRSFFVSENHVLAGREAARAEEWARAVVHVQHQRMPYLYRREVVVERGE